MIIHPTRLRKFWPTHPLGPVKLPTYRRLPERPKLSRKKGHNEPTKRYKLPKIEVVIHCDLFHEAGHNRTRYPHKNDTNEHQSATNDV